MESTLQLLSLFSGIGAFEKALDNLNINYELVGYCEIDKYASQAYSIIHNVPETKNFWDITKLDEKQLPLPIDLITYGFPCQDISRAGKERGLFDNEGNKTRSGLFFDALRLIEYSKPKIAIAENVKNLTGEKFKEQFEIVLESLDKAGYNNYWKVLCGKDYGTPQMRERVFIISIRKDIDNGRFTFPRPTKMKKCMEDYLETEVPSKYYLSTEKLEGMEWFKDKVDMYKSHWPWLPDYLGWEESCFEIAHTNYSTYDMSNRIYSPKGCCPTLMASAQGDSVCKIYTDKGIRRLTEREYLRLTGFDDTDVDKLEAAHYPSRKMYKVAGNSIVVSVLEAIFGQLKMIMNIHYEVA